MTPLCQKVLDLLSQGTLNYQQAKQKGIRDISDTISRLRKEGHAIKKKMVLGKLPTGKVIQYAEYYLEGAQKYRRGQRKPERVKHRKYTCKVGDIVLHEGKRVSVAEVLAQGSEIRQAKAFICGYLVLPDGMVLKRTTVCCGYDWEHID